ncbi:MAG: putative repeat protein (TIGR01451 family) [Saprospiraceae bacterium]|jgi:uncharacterized repeat protein (TIGR01451 family)
MKSFNKPFLLLIIILTAFTNVNATGEASTYFQIFVPPNADYSSRAVNLVITAIYDNTTFDIVDDGMDGDTDDSVSGTLMAGQSYILYIKDNGVNDDKGGKQDGDYFIVTSSNLIFASQSTNSDWQHDWVPATNKTSKGQRFIVYAPEKSYSNRDLNVYAFEDSTTVTIRAIHKVLKTTTGYTSVQIDSGIIIKQRTLNIGEDIIFEYTDGKNIMESGGTYLIESNKPITVQYGALSGNAKDGGGYVPSDNGSSSGDLFYFTVHTQSAKEQEIRVVSWDSTNAVTLDYYNNGSWINVTSWNLNNLEPGDWISYSGNIDKVFRITCTPGKQVSVFEANWLETGNPGTSDVASMMSGRDGKAAGKDFLAYMAPPGNEANVLNPFTGTNDLGKSTHLYIFAKDSANVTIVDAKTGGQVINRTYTIAPGRYIDCALNLAEWKSIYNGNGNPNSGSDRPYLLVNADIEVSVFNTNFNDNWMAYFGTSKTQDFIISGDVIDPTLGFINDCFGINDTAIINNQLTFSNAQYDLLNPTVEVVVPDGAVVLYSNLENLTTNQVYPGIISINTNTGKTTINFANLPTFQPLHTYVIETAVTLAINQFNGDLIIDRTLLTTETIISGIFDGEFQQATEATGVLICSDIILPQNIVTPQANTWSVAWGDYNNDCYPDLFIANYDSDEANILYKNNGDGTFTETSTALFGADMASSTVGTWGDYDNDGDLDLFVANNIGTGNYLYRNENGTSFTRIYNDPIVNDLGYAHGATWVDYDNDGFLDMFTAEFFTTRFNNLYHNNGDGTFTKNTTANIALDAASSVAGVWGDYDNDGDQDLFVANTNNENNLLYRNEGNGNFTKITTGAIVTDGGQSVGGSWGDYDNDNDLDLFVSNSGLQNNFLYKNNGDGTFTKITTGDIVTDGGHSHGSSWGDVDNDGFLDLLVTNDQNSVNYLYLNNGDGTFNKIDHRLSLFTTGGGNSFGSAFADFDNDGDLDLFVANHADQSNVLIQNYNAASSDANFINIKLNGTNSNAAAIGSRIAVKATIDGTSMWLNREIAGLTGGGIGGQNDVRAHFGLGNATIIDSLIVTWSSGFKQIETNITVNQSCYSITELAGGTISGTVYFDANKNEIQDNDELGIPGITVLVQETGMSLTTDDNGDYEVVLNIGTYTLQQFPGANWSQYLPALSTPLTVNVTQIGASYPDNNFADTAACLNPDLLVELNTTALRVGFENLYAITYRNTGTATATNANLTVDFGQYVIPVSANLPWDNVSGTAYTWNLGTIDFGGSFTIIVVDSVSTDVNIGDDLTVTGSITSNETECNPNDNQTIDINEAVGAIDPNDITAYPGDFITYNQEVTYRIRFQNVGNAVANRVVVRSDLPENLDIATLIRGQVSHPSIFNIEDARTMVWDFENINLIDSNANEAESHGFIWFKVKPTSNIESGEKIQNFATIFFDNAAPIVTNTATVTVTGSQEAGVVSVFPNPVGNDAVTLKLEDVDLNGEERIQTVRIYDMRGVLLHVETGFDDKQVQLLPLDLPAGNYVIVAISNEGNTFVGKMVKL